MNRRGFLSGLIGAAVVGIAAIPVARPARAAFQVEAANQTGCSLVTWPLERDLHVGDIVTVDGVEAVNRRIGEPSLDYKHTGELRQFIIVAPAPKGNRVVHIYPPLIPVYSDKYYATVVSAPKARATIKIVATNYPSISFEKSAGLTAAV